MGAKEFRPAIFLDRDGTIIVDRGDLGEPSAIELLPGVADVLRDAQRRFALFIVTHQPAVAAGRLTMGQVEAVNDALVALLRRAGIAIERVFVCPHARADGCECIKPKPYFLNIAAWQHDIDLRRSFTIGDHPHDAELALSVGATGIYVLTGHGLKHRDGLRSGFVVVPSLADTRRALMLDTREADDIERAAAIVRRGGVVAFPTETVYGLGTNALDVKAVTRVFEIKHRPFFDPLIVHVDSPAWVERLAREVPASAVRLMEKFWPGPLTLVLPKTPLVPDIVTAGLDTVALRMPAHETARALVRAAGVPICAPSANPFGYVSPTRAEHVSVQLGDAVECIIDGGPCSVGIESTIIGFDKNMPRLLRPGGIPVEEISSVLGVPISPEAHRASVVAPGMLPRHYSPRIPVRLFTGAVPPPPSSSAGLLLYSRRGAPPGYVVVDVLSERGEAAEAARNLFACLRRLDSQPITEIVAELAPEQGIGRSINDRLRRASFRGDIG